MTLLKLSATLSIPKHAGRKRQKKNYACTWGNVFCKLYIYIDKKTVISQLMDMICYYCRAGADLGGARHCLFKPPPFC